MKITVKKLSELHKPAHNIRRHSEKQLTEYIRSIEMFGQVKPLVVAEDGEIIAGNGLYIGDSAAFNGKLLDGTGVFVKFHCHILQMPV